MRDARADYFRAMRAIGDRHTRDMRRIGPFIPETPSGIRVEAILDHESIFHLKDMHGVTLSNKDEVEWLKRKNPEVVPKYAGKVRVSMRSTALRGIDRTDRTDRTDLIREVAAGRLTRFGRASFTRAYG